MAVAASSKVNRSVGLRGTNSKTALQLLAIAPAQAEFCVVFKEHVVLAILIEGEAPDPIEVDDGRAVDATEEGGIQILLELRDAAAQHVSSLGHVEASVVVGRFDPIDFRGLEEGDLARVFDDEAVESSGETFAESDFLPRAFQGEIETCIVERLEEIIEGSGLERAEGVLIVSGDEDDGGGDIVAEKFEHVEAVALGHLYVEEEEFGFELADEGGRFDAGAALGEDFDRGIEAQEDGEIASREGFVVDDEGG
jgi:hypothetical protein